MSSKSPKSGELNAKLTSVLLKVASQLGRETQYDHFHVARISTRNDNRNSDSCNHFEINEGDGNNEKGTNYNIRKKY